MELKWLYRPKVMLDLGRRPAWVRPTTIDIETIVDLAELIELRAPHSEVEVHVTDKMRTRRRKVALEDLAALDAGDRRYLEIEAHHPSQNSFVWLLIRGDQRMQVNAAALLQGGATDPEQAANDLVIELAEKIANNGTPIFEWRRLLTGAPYVALIALGVAWVWTEFLVPMPLPMHIAGWLLFAFAALVARSATRDARDRLLTAPVGIRIRQESRVETSARRADTRMNIKVAVITALISIPTTILITLISTGL